MKSSLTKRKMNIKIKNCEIKERLRIAMKNIKMGEITGLH